MNSSTKLERLLSVILTIATVAVAIIVVEGRIRPRPALSQPTRTEKIEDWSRQVADSRVWLSDSTLPVSVAVFTDFECPFCRMLDSVVTDIEERYPGTISRSIVHFPLSNHRFALPAARALECAVNDGRQSDMHRALFENQAQFGLKPWSEIAAEAGIQDTNAFKSCFASRERLPRVEAGTSLATKLRLSGTPVVVLNGMMHDPVYIPTMASALEAAAKSAATPRKD